MFLLAAVAAWGGGILYSLKVTPEIHYYVQGAEIKDRWAEQMTREHGAKILVYGGSSCAFSIDGERMLDRFGLPTVNYGRGAGMGAAVLTESVLAQARPGDTLIVALEPGLLTDPLDQLAEGVQFSFAVHHPEWVLHPALGVSQMNWFQALNALRPGGTHLFTLLGKVAGHKPLLRYHVTDYRPSGFEQTAVRVKNIVLAGHGPDLSADAGVLLRNLRAWCDQRHVRVAYSMPWSYASPDQERAFRRSNIRLLLEINQFVPVLKDPNLGASTNLEFYADTGLHLTEAGSAQRTDQLSAAIKNWDTWSPEALRARDAELAPPASP
jgi:hypothetical protein